MARKPATKQDELNWYEASQLGRIYVSSEVIMYSIQDVAEMTGWSHTTVEKLFNDPKFPAADYGKRKLVENHALMQLPILVHCLQYCERSHHVQIVRSIPLDEHSAIQPICCGDRALADCFHIPD